MTMDCSFSYCAGFSCKSIIILIASPTRTPLVSSAWFRVRRNSFPEIFPSTSKAVTSMPQGFLTIPSYSTSNVAFFVTPLNVVPPVTLYLSLFVFMMSVETNVRCGYFLRQRSRQNAGDCRRR